MREVALRWAPLPILAIGALLAWVLIQGRSAGAPAPAAVARPVVRVVPAVATDHPVVLRTHGTVQARTEIELVAEVAGRVAAVAPALAPGSFFEAGALLVELDPTDAELALERARAGRLRADSQQRLARTRLERRRSLAEREIASSAQLEEAQYAENVARAAAREARATVDQARRDLDRTRIRAPFAGRVRSQHVDVGQFVGRGTSLARLYAVDYAEVRLPLPSDELAWLELPWNGSSGEAATRPEVTLRADFAGSRAAWRARIVRSEAEIAARSRMLHVVARVEDPYGLRAGAEGRASAPLTVGLFVEAEIRGRTLADVFVLPRSALASPGRVLVVDDRGRVGRREVEVLRRDGDWIVVGSGLSPGERVCVSAATAVEGMEVTARPIEVVPPTSFAGVIR